MKTNMQRLGDTLAGRINKSAKAHTNNQMIELGTIVSGMALLTDSIQTPIQKGQYMVNLLLKSKTYRTSKDVHNHSGGDHSHADGLHDHRLPEDFRLLEVGDRVLVAWAGNEPVVLAIVVSS